MINIVPRMQCLFICLLNCLFYLLQTKTMQLVVTFTLSLSHSCICHPSFYLFCVNIFRALFNKKIEIKLPLYVTMNVD